MTEEAPERRETFERPEVRDLLDRGPPLLACFTWRTSSCSPYGRMFCTSLQMWCSKEGFLSLIVLVIVASFFCISSKWINASWWRYLMCR